MAVDIPALFVLLFLAQFQGSATKESNRITQQTNSILATSHFSAAGTIVITASFETSVKSSFFSSRMPPSSSALLSSSDTPSPSDSPSSSDIPSLSSYVPSLSTDTASSSSETPSLSSTTEASTQLTNVSSSTTLTPSLPTISYHPATKSSSIIIPTPSSKLHPSSSVRPENVVVKCGAECQSLTRRLWAAGVFAVLFGLTTVIFMFLLFRQCRISKDYNDQALSRLI